jgi:hypothetical protein
LLARLEAHEANCLETSVYKNLATRFDLSC